MIVYNVPPTNSSTIEGVTQSSRLLALIKGRSKPKPSTRKSDEDLRRETEEKWGGKNNQRGAKD